MDKEKLKEFIKTPRGKGLFKLGLFIIFFIFVFGYYGISKPMPKPVKKDALSEFENMTNYEYQYKYNELEYNGKVYRNKMYFTMDNQEYMVDNEVYSKTELGEYEVVPLNKIYYYNNIDISEMLKKGNIIAKTEDFSTDSIITKYLVDTDYVEIYVKDDVIYKTVLEIGNDKIEINYMNVGKVTNPAS